MSLRHLWAFLAVALPVLAALIAPLPATDLTYHLRAGEEILTTGRIPAVDTWTFTIAGEPWLDQQWGAQVILTAVYRVAGWTGLVLFRAALVGLIAATIFELCRRQGTGVRLAAWLALGAFAVSAPALALRPQLIAMALFALTLFLVVDRAAHPRRLWLVVPIAILWANVHGSFFLAPAVLGLAWIADIAERSRAATSRWPSRCDRRRLLPDAVWPVRLGVRGAARCKPGGDGPDQRVAADLAARHLGDPVLRLRPARRGIPRPPRTADAMADAAVARLLLRHRRLRGAGYRVVAVRRGGRPRAAHRRGPVAVEERSPNAARMRARMPSWRERSSWPASRCCRSGARPTRTSASRREPQPGTARLTDAVREAAAPGDRLLVPQPWASWFEFATPDLPVAVDSRIELFPNDVWADYLTVTQGGDGWEDVLAAWAPTLVVAATMVRRSPGRGRLDGDSRR